MGVDFNEPEEEDHQLRNPMLVGQADVPSSSTGPDTRTAKQTGPVATVEKSLQGQWREMPPASMAVEEKERGLVEPVHLDNKFAALTFMEENDDLTGVFAQVISPSSSSRCHLKRS